MNRLVEGIRVPHAVAGHPALELCNTRAIWWTATPVEYLRDYPSLVVIAREFGVLTPDEAVALRAADRADPAKGAEILGRVIRLRADVYAAVAEQPDSEAPENVRNQVLDALRVSRYQPLDDGRLALDGGSGLGIPLHRFALAAHDLLTQHGPVEVGRCMSDACGWVFLDPSHRRHWCVMAVCGNRAKVKRYAERRRAALATSGASAPAG
jgi:predicted RNA-binding Zn ribbon-like protein